MKRTISLTITLIAFSNLVFASSTWSWWQKKPTPTNTSRPEISSTTVYLPLWGTTGRRNANALIIKPKKASGKSLTQWTCSTTDDAGNIILGGTSNNRFAVAWITPGETPTDALDGSVIIFPAIAGGTKEKCKAIMVDTNGYIILVGTSSVPAGNNYFAAARVTPKKTIDTSFGKNGMVRITGSFAGGVNDQCNAVAIDNFSNIILAGTSADRSSSSFFCAVRLTSKGILDTTFGKRGVAVLPSLGGGINNQCQTVTVDQFNNIILSGTSFDKTGNSYFAAIKIPALTN